MLQSYKNYEVYIVHNTPISFIQPTEDSRTLRACLVPSITGGNQGSAIVTVKVESDQRRSERERERGRDR